MQISSYGLKIINIRSLELDAMEWEMKEYEFNWY